VDRLPGVAEFRGRRTCRVNVVARLIGYALGGRAGERLAHRIGLPISNDTLLRCVKKGARPEVTGAQVIGIDEWAKRKGRTYGTIVVDLERHTVVDVLDQHSSEAVEQWLRAHPNIQTICRDRNGRYARAARVAAPTATQVTDRFHLVQNLRETIRTGTGAAPRLPARAGDRERTPRGSAAGTTRHRCAPRSTGRARAAAVARPTAGNADRDQSPTPTG
jgi:hypothetical protein